MRILRAMTLVLLLTTSLAMGPVAAPAAAHHACHEDVPCVPHDIKPLVAYVGDLVRCLVLVQPPTACV